MLGWILFGAAALAAVVVVLGAALLGSMFLGSPDGGDQLIGVVIVVTALLWAAVVGVAGWLLFRGQQQPVALLVLAVHVAVDVGLLALLSVAVEAAARP